MQTPSLKLSPLGLLNDWRISFPHCIGMSTSSKLLSHRIEGLSKGIRYHFRYRLLKGAHSVIFIPTITAYYTNDDCIMQQMARDQKLSSNALEKHFIHAAGARSIIWPAKRLISYVSWVRRQIYIKLLIHWQKKISWVILNTGKINFTLSVLSCTCTNQHFYLGVSKGDSCSI